MLKKRYFHVLTFLVLNVFLVLFIVQEKNFAKQAREVAVQFKMNFLKDSVSNFVNEFNRGKNDAAEAFDVKVSERENILRDYLHNANSRQAAEWAI